ncbi:HepT-like ribonuclease domain-containing protein [Spirosoma pollinicola]|uniref:DUF86 domain-containing protein n=1 Tax=Spirosoma pollinicola TaxID=2057025 RepID=A0A2K8Z5W9_9BACT|nr:HepT-like ribonuclease domain-containing protein [Spirosoma pollinicola]AUD05286.1 hypothetical protein CWM47_27630 [Spirosoma pollinicola]
MYNRRNFIHLCTILECIEKITIYSCSFNNADDFFAADDQVYYNASWALLLVIGEDSKKLAKELKNDYPAVPWRLLSGTRNFLAHEYRALNQQLIFDIIRQNLPSLKNTVISMFHKVDYSSEVLEAALSSDYYRHIQYLREKLND